ncbi:MAG: isopentenyl phosphate kinase [Thermoanaerobaculia bacterium]
MTDVILVKLGGSLITDKRRESYARLDVIDRLAAEIAAARRRMTAGLVVSHGSGSFGHVAAARHGLGRGPVDDNGLAGVVETRNQAARLHRIVIDALMRADVHTFSWVPSNELIATAGQPAVGSCKSLLKALELGLVPVTYGDVVPDSKWRMAICSTETILRYVVDGLRRRGFVVRRILWLGETEGVYDRAGNTVPRIDGATYREVLELVDDPSGTDVTGGMLLRLETTRALARIGIESWILDGRVPGRLTAGLSGEDVPGTRFVADDYSADGIAGGQAG